jgi:hypothetical protein
MSCTFYNNLHTAYFQVEVCPEACNFVDRLAPSSKRETMMAAQERMMVLQTKDMQVSIRLIIYHFRHFFFKGTDDSSTSTLITGSMP